MRVFRVPVDLDYNSLLPLKKHRPDALNEKKGVDDSNFAQHKQFVGQYITMADSIWKWWSSWAT